MNGGSKPAHAPYCIQHGTNTCEKEMSKNNHYESPFAVLDEKYQLLSSLPDLTPHEDIPEGLTPDILDKWKGSRDNHKAPYFTEQLSDVRQRLLEAAHLCRYLDLNIIPASIEEVAMYKGVLSAAIYKAETLYSDIELDFPLPKNASDFIDRDIEMPHEKYLPQMCYRDEEAAVIYLPQQRTRRNAKGLPTSLHISEFQEFLLAADFPSLTNWQADFIHVFHPDDTRYCRDVDNYEYKKYIDLIARKMGAMDSGTHFSLAMHNEFTAAIAPGTYIVIQQRISPLPALLSCISEMQQTSEL